MITTGDEVEIREYKRLTKLTYQDRALGNNYLHILIKRGFFSIGLMRFFIENTSWNRMTALFIVDDMKSSDETMDIK